MLNRFMQQKRFITSVFFEAHFGHYETLTLPNRSPDFYSYNYGARAHDTQIADLLQNLHSVFFFSVSIILGRLTTHTIIIKLVLFMYWQAHRINTERARYTIRIEGIRLL